MKKLLILLFLITTSFVQAQNIQLAYDYFRKGEYQKAATIYNKLYQKNTNSSVYFKQLVKCYQELDNFVKADDLIQKQITSFPKRYYLNVTLGYNYQLQNLKEKAEPLYQKAIDAVEINPSSAYRTGKAFQDSHLLDYAMQVYTKAMEINPRLNLHLYIANIYGERAEIDKMFDAYLDMVAVNANYYSTIQRYIGKFITDDSQNNNNKIFRKLLLKRLQNNPNDSWNKLLAWMYMQQKDYNKALVQEKALYKRSSSDSKRIFELGNISFYEKQYETAKNSFHFIIENTNNQNEILNAELALLQIDVKTAKNKEEYNLVNSKFNQIFTKYGKGRNTVSLQIAYADFLVFTENKPNEALVILKEAIPVASSRYIKGDIKIKLADIMVYTNKFNQALINYTQVQSDLRGSDVAQIARLKVAKTSYYKGDFDWAKTQLKVLKSATSKLISNDALKLNLLIGDNIADDTIRTALKKYATADLLAYQNKNKQAIDTLSVLLRDFKGHAIEDEALFKQAALFKITKQFAFAENNYHKIIQLKKDGILADDAYYQLGELYTNELADNEKAKEMYQKIIFDYASSIHLVDARKKFRKLRGDNLE